MSEKNEKIVEIDATGLPLGRLASQIAVILRGKNSPDFRPHLLSGNKVVVKNAKFIKFTGNKMQQKKYYSYSGYPGGLKEKKLSVEFKKNPGWVVRKAVYNMLPGNKLRDKIIKNLKVE